MAQSIEEILGRDINSVRDLKNAMNELADSMAKLSPETQEFKDASVQLAAAQEQLNNISRARKGNIDAEEGSIVALENEYRNLYNEYKRMGQAWRESEEGIDKANKLKAISEELNNLKQNVGNFKDNIGRYTQSMVDAFKMLGVNVSGLIGPFKTATQGVNGLSAAMKANPIGMIIAAIQVLITLFKKVKDAVSSNEELQMRWNQAMAAFKPIADGVTNVIDGLAKAFVGLVEGISKAIKAVREFFTFSEEGKKKLKEQQKLYDDIAQSQVKLTKAQREYSVQNAKDSAAVERLREEASETENLQEKKDKLIEAKNIQAEIDARNLEIAQEELRILQEQAQTTANDAEMNDKLAQAMVNVANAEAAAASNARRFNKEIKAATSSTKSASSGAKNYREEAKKIYEETIENSKDEVQKLTEKYQKEKKLLEKYHYDTKLLTKKFNEDMKKLEKERYEASVERYGKEVSEEKYSEDLAINALKTQVERMEAVANQSREAYEKAYDTFAAYQNATLQATKKAYLDIFNQQTGENAKTEEDMINILNIMYNKTMQDTQAAMQYVAGLNEDAARSTLDQVTTLIDRYRFEEDGNKERLKESLTQLIEKSGIFPDMEDLDEFFESIESQAGANEWIEKAMAMFRDENHSLWEKMMIDFKDADDETKIAISNKYMEAIREQTEALVAEEELSAERVANIWSDAFADFDAHAQAIQTVTNALSSMIQAQIQDGKITEQQAKKKKKTLENLEKVALAVNIAQIAASTASGIMDVWKSYGAELALNAQTAAATGPAAAATKAALDGKSLASALIRTTTLATTGAANIAAATMGTISKINAMRAEDSSGGGSVGVAATVQEIDSTPYSYTRQVQTAEEEDAIYNKQYFVSVTDINNVQNQVKVTQEESSF